MIELTDQEKEILAKVAWIIHKKGHLTFKALQRFTGIDKDTLKKFYHLGILKKHRSDTYELSPRGRVLGMKYNPRFRK